MVQVARHPLIQFSYDSLVWQDNSYFFLEPLKVVAYPADSTLPGKYYTRYTLQAFGHDSKGNSLQFNISFDASDPNQLVGTYRQAYSQSSGLAQAALYGLDNNNLSEYTLNPADTTAFLQIKRQSGAESLIAGTFQMILDNTRDTARKIVITNGSLTDIIY